MSNVIRVNVEATDDEKYVDALTQAVTSIKTKTWAELTPEEKDKLSEFLAYKAGLVRPPRSSP